MFWIALFDPYCQLPWKITFSISPKLHCNLLIRAPSVDGIYVDLKQILGTPQMKGLPQTLFDCKNMNWITHLFHRESHNITLYFFYKNSWQIVLTVFLKSMKAANFNSQLSFKLRALLIRLHISLNCCFFKKINWFLLMAIWWQF